MSCMIQKSENTAAIADYIADLLNYGLDYNGMSAPESLGFALADLKCGDVYGYYDAEKIYFQLVNMNHAAWLGRYPQQGRERVPEYKSNRITKRIEYDNSIPYSGRYTIADWHYIIYKMIQFYNYQCMEDATDQSDLFKGMQELERNLAAFIVNNNPVYTSLEWE